MGFLTVVLASLPGGFLGGVAGNLAMELFRHRLAVSRELGKEQRDEARRRREDLVALAGTIRELMLRMKSFTAEDVDRLVATAVPAWFAEHLGTVRMQANRCLELRTKVDQQRERADGARVSVARAGSSPAVAQRRASDAMAVLAILESEYETARDILRHSVDVTAAVANDLRGGARSDADLRDRLEQLLAGRTALEAK